MVFSVILRGLVAIKAETGQILKINTKSIHLFGYGLVAANRLKIAFMPGTIKLKTENNVVFVRTFKDSKEIRKIFEQFNNWIKEFGDKEKAYHFLIKIT